MQIKLPTIDIRMRKVGVPTPDTEKARSELNGLRGRAADLRDAASDRASELRDTVVEHVADLRDAAGDRAGELRDTVVERASDLRDIAAERTSELVDRAPDVTLPEMKLPRVDLPSIDLPSIDLPNVDIGKAVAPTARAVGEGIQAVAESFRSIGRGIEQWRKPKKQQPPLAETGIALLAGIGGGMALMFFLDPDKGRRRRSLLRAKVGRWSRQAGAALHSTHHQVAIRGQGLAAGVGSMGGGQETPSDADTQIGVMDAPDPSASLMEVDSAAGRDDQDAGTSSGHASKPEIYGQAWGETGTTGEGPAHDMGRITEDRSGIAEAVPEEQRESIGSTSEG